MNTPHIRLKELCEVITKGTTPTSLGFDFSDNGVGFLRVQNVSGGKVNFERDTLFINEQVHQELRRSQILPGDVLLSIAGTIGRTGVVPENAPPLNCNQAIAIVRPKGKVFRSYLRHWLESNDAQSQMRGSTVTGTIQNLSLAQVGSLKVPLPPLPEQIRIAAILDQADALRVKRREALAQLDSLTQSIFIEMFGDPVINPKGWQCAEMTDVVIGKYGVKAGPFGSSLKKEDYTPTGYRVYGQEQVIAGRFDIGDYYISARKFEQLKSCAVCEGDLLVSLVGSFGKVLVVPSGIEPGIINPRLLKITPNPQLITSVFLAATLTLPATQTAFERMAHGGTMGILNAGLLKQLIVMLPPLALQHEYEKRIFVIERLKQMHCTSLADLNALFASLQHRAFRGEL